MGDKATFYRSLVGWLALAVTSGVLLGPIVVYVHTFGTTLSGEHDRWAEMGSAMSGIYSPILAIIGAVLLARQLVGQEAMNKHYQDRAHIDAAREDLHYYMGELRHLLDKSDHGAGTVQRTLAYIERMDDPNERRKRHQALGVLHPQLSAVWGAIYAIVAGLGRPEESAYHLARVISLQKLIATNSMATCIYLDRFYKANFPDCDNQFEFEKRPDR